MKRIMTILPAALLAGCEMAPPALTAPRMESPQVAPLSGTDLDQQNIEKVRASESLKAYPVGRSIDGRDPNVMHEAHLIYRREANSSWNLQPNAPTVVPLGPVLAVADPARQPNPLPAELEIKVAEQNQLMSSLIKQNEALAAQLAKLNSDIADLQQRQGATDRKGKAP